MTEKKHRKININLIEKLAGPSTTVRLLNNIGRILETPIDELNDAKIAELNKMIKREQNLLNIISYQSHRLKL